MRAWEVAKANSLSTQVHTLHTTATLTGYRSTAGKHASSSRTPIWGCDSEPCSTIIWSLIWNVLSEILSRDLPGDTDRRP